MGVACGVCMRHSWIFEVLADLRAYALANGLPNLARKTIEAENAAKTDISEESGAGEAEREG
jgi:hypothetical protein